ncbi:Uncharacterised protein r2_g1640 [Pycnogonum litorale]
MSELPIQRLKPDTPAFHITAVDLFGPFRVRISRNKTDKHYGIIFTCLNSRAVHLEMSTDYSTSAFLQALRRFFAIRGYPAEMRSDRGTQLIGAEKELKLMVPDWDWQTLKDYGTNRKMKWIFHTPAAPHMSGAVESLVRSVKYALKKSIGDSVLSQFELYTVLLEAANLVNQRPIGRKLNDPDDGATLCPNDLLFGRASSCVPQGPFQQSKNPRERLSFIQQIVDSFWKRWTRDTFSSLITRQKWQKKQRDVQVGTSRQRAGETQR